MSLFSILASFRFSWRDGFGFGGGSPGITFNGTDANDSFNGACRADTAFGFGGDDRLTGGSGNDTLYGGSGNDVVNGNNGNDKLYGDGPAELVALTTDFSDAASWQPALSGNGTVIDLDGATITAVGGTFSAFRGLSILSPSDNNPRQGWTQEIDGFNDTPETVEIAFDSAQASVSLTLAQIFVERIFVVETEIALVKVLLENGSVVNTTISANALANTGEVSMTIDGGLTGGLKILGLELTPNLALPSGVPPQFATNINALNPFTEWTVKNLTFSVDKNTLGSNDDTLHGGNGCDHLFGGRGNDRLFGGNDSDTLSGGAGDNFLHGGHGADTFLFGADATGVNTIAAFRRHEDRLVFQDGVTVVGSSFAQGDTTLTLSNGGSIILDDVRLHHDWHLFAC